MREKIAVLLSMIIIVLSSSQFSIISYAEVGDGTSNEPLESEEKNLKLLATEKISDAENKPIIVTEEIIADEPKMLESETEIADELPKLNDGLIASLDTDTEVYDGYTVSENHFTNKSSIVSDGSININVKKAEISKIIISESDINLNASGLYSPEEEITIIYSKHGNINLSIDNCKFKGLIYAPEGVLVLDGTEYDIDGMVLAKKMDISADFFDIKMNEEVNERYNILSAIDLKLIEDMSEIYGETYTDIDYEKLAKCCIISSEEGMEEEDFEKVTLSQRIELYDANDVVTNYAYNYSVKASNTSGYVVLGTHSKTYLINTISKGSIINNAEISKIYFFSNNEIYFEKQSGYETFQNVVISKEEFLDYKEEKKMYYYNINKDMLDMISQENKSIKDNLENSASGLNEEIFMGKHYDGTDAGAYGYGGIALVSKYLKSRYGGTPSVKEAGKTLAVSTSTMSEASGKTANNCSIVSISKVLHYWKHKRGKNKIGSSLRNIYKKTEKIGKKYGYTDTIGTQPTKINNITADVLEEYGYSSSCKGVYIWTFSGQVKSEIEAEQPVIMNIARGYYGNHTVTVVGYRIFKTSGKEYPMIKVADGWEKGTRYIDYNAFAYDLVTSGFGSFNTTVIK